MSAGVDPYEWVRRFEGAIRERRDELTDLDRRSGDGDFGTNVSGALSRALGRFDAGDAGAFGAVSHAFLNTGGTSGPLFGMWFRGLAGAAEGAGALTLAALADGAAVGLASVRRFGRAEVGDKTMVDALEPAVTALRDGLELDAAIDAALGAAASAARLGALSTTGLIARRGRASYVGEAAIGVTDPGALTVAIFFEVAPLGS